MAFTIDRVTGSAMRAETRAALLAMCDAAYGEPTRPYLDDIGPGSIFGPLRRGAGSHLMWVTRRLQLAGMAPLRTAYVELVATAPEAQGRGYATRLPRPFRGWSRSTSWRR